MNLTEDIVESVAGKLEQQFPIGTAANYLDGEAALMLRHLRGELSAAEETIKTLREWRGPLRWDKMTDDDVCAYSFELAGALRYRRKFRAAVSLQKIADDLFPGKIKPAPIVPRTTQG